MFRQMVVSEILKQLLEKLLRPGEKKTRKPIFSEIIVLWLPVTLNTETLYNCYERDLPRSVFHYVKPVKERFL